MSARYPIQTITPDEFDAFTAVPGHAFLEDWPPEARDIERRVIEFDRSIAAFDGVQIVGTASAYSFRLTVPGGGTRPGYRTSACCRVIGVAAS